MTPKNQQPVTPVPNAQGQTVQQIADAVRKQQYQSNRPIPLVAHASVVSNTLSGTNKQVAISWQNAQDPTIDRFEVWVARATYTNGQPAMVASVTGSPATFTLPTNGGVAAIAYIRTVNKYGYRSSLLQSPTVSFTL